MRTKVGLWIDHRKAIIVAITDKGELKKRLKKARLGGRIVGMETVDKMTDHQIAAKVRQHFQESSAPK